VSRSWAELLGDETGADAEESEESSGLFSRLRDSLGKSRRALTEQIAVAAFDPGDSASRQLQSWSCGWRLVATAPISARPCRRRLQDCWGSLRAWTWEPGRA
jgi:hypothetical protein